MKHFFKALLCAGFFICIGTANANQWPSSIDWGAKTMPSSLATTTTCKGELGQPDFTIAGKVLSSDCSIESTKRYTQVRLDQINAGRACATTVVSKTANGWQVQDHYLNKDGNCYQSGSPYWISVGSSVLRYEETTKCPPDATGQPKEDAYKSKFRIKAKERMPSGGAGAADVCYKPVDPISCDSLKGYGTTGSDYFITDSVDYKHPSCITIVTQDKDGNRKAGNCQVIAKSWIQQPVGAYGGNMKQWTPMVGTITGKSCGAEEQKQEPPEEQKPKCWSSTNNLNMCQANPEEKCVVTNGVSKCETGCGYINGDFWCASKDPTKNPTPPKQDQVPTAPTDTISDPTKTMANMTKSDFKDAQIGVESRLTQVNTTITNVENSIDQSNTLLSDISLNTEQSLTNDNITNSLLTDIKNQLADGNGDGTGGGDGGGECDPKSDPTCATGGDAGNPSSWWTSVYPNGIQGIINDKKSDFQQTDAYKSMTQNIDVGSGTLQPWQLCFNAKALNFGCFNLEIPPFVLAFVRLIMLFSAAILCRRMLIGA